MSDELDGRHFEEALLTGNANADYMGQQLADLMRHLLRLSVNGDNGVTLLNASTTLKRVLQLAQRAPTGVTFHDVIQAAVNDMAPVEPRGAAQQVCLDLAKDGVRYFLEMSSTDGFSGARASKRLSALRQSARELDEDIRMRRDADDRARTARNDAMRTRKPTPTGH